jgi:hypothetical protein
VSETFDMPLRALRRDRAARTGAELFLLERVFADCLERVELLGRQFARALLLGSPDPGWAERLGALAGTVDVRDPGRLFAQAAGGRIVIEDGWLPEPGAYDLVIAIGPLDTVNGLPLALRLLFEALMADGLLIGAMSGGDTLPLTRAAMRAADQAGGAVSAHVHPRVEAAALAPLLEHAGFVRPVVDIDRIAVAYSGFARLIGDLRGMAATNVLLRRDRKPILKKGLAAALECFAQQSENGRASETFEILHFAAWRAHQG